MTFKSNAKTINKNDDMNNSQETHKCNHIHCRNCGEYDSATEHKCYIQKQILEAPNNNIIYFDFEAQQETGEHEVNLACVSYGDNNSYDDADKEHMVEKEDRRSSSSPTLKFDSLEAFCKWLIKDKHISNNYNAIAHNGKGYDFQFILSYCVNNGIEPFTIYAGGKIMMMSIGRGKNKLRLIDSLNFLMMPLKKFPETFGLTELKKGYFPHFFNTKENEKYVGKMPAKKHYGYNQMNKNDREAFLKWYEIQESTTFNMEKDILEYCISDVDILKQGCEAFRKLFIENEGIDPFNQVTIASTCMKLYRAKYMEEKTIAILPEVRTPETHSRVSIEWLEWVKAKNNIQIQHATNGFEFKVPYWSFVPDVKGTQKARDGTLGKFERFNYKVDGYCEDNQTVYEFHGCYWHGCPSCYENRPRTLNKVSNKTMEELHRATQKRIENIRKQGYDVVEMWECQWKRMKNNSKEICGFLKENEINVIDRLNPRAAMFGGRTNATKLHWDGEGKGVRSTTPLGERSPASNVRKNKFAHYADITSLYPTVNYYDEYPACHPDIITTPEKKKIENREYFGLVKCKVLPPSNLYHPVLPAKLNGKLMFPLCFKCAVVGEKGECSHCDADRSLIGTWGTPELYRAMDLGYQVVSVFEVWHWKETSTSLFKSYVARFLKLKQEASGFPSWVENEADKHRYIRDYKEKQGVDLEYNKIKKNPGQRAMAKMCLNSLWGKFGQNPHKQQTKFIKNHEQLYKLLTNDKIDKLDLNMINENCIEATYMEKTDHIEDQTNSNIAIAIFTTCHARVRLHRGLRKLDRQVLYYDTDSIVYADGKESLELGDYLGDWTDELEGANITKFVAGGPKNYGYTLDNGKSKCKIKGFSLNYENSQVLNLPNMLSIITKGLGIDLENIGGAHLISGLPDEEKNIAERVKRNGRAVVWNNNQITRVKKHKQVVSKYMEKVYGFTYTKRRIIVEDDGTIDTLPFGYKIL